MALALYSTLFRLLLPLFALRLLIRSRKAPAYRQRIAERLGFSTPVAGRPLWIHAVSVGEVIAITPLVEKLLENYPDIPVLITTMTPTGAAQVEQRFGHCGAARVSHRYIPWDTPGAVARFFRNHQPRAGLIVETELWPNLLRTADRLGIPLVLANARLSAKSQRGYQRFSALTNVALSSLTHICAQHDADAQRFIELGVPTERVSVDGSIKFDLSIPPEAIQQGKVWREALGNRPVLIAASTHAGEDEIALQAWQQLKQSLSDAVLILVPRHPERFDSVATLAQGYSTAVQRRSSNDLPDLITEIWIGDSLGEMLAYYATADIAFVGGSFSGTGGHNPLEPAALSLPVIMGPSRYNFLSIAAELENEGALFEVESASELAATAGELLSSDGAAAKDAGEAGLRVVERNRGALERLLLQVERHLLS